MSDESNNTKKLFMRKITVKFLMVTMAVVFAAACTNTKNKDRQKPFIKQMVKQFTHLLKA